MARSYRGGFPNVGKGTPDGDGKDKAMRAEANSCIVELDDPNRASSSGTTLRTLGPYDDALGVTVMLARNSKLSTKALRDATKESLRRAHHNGCRFLVGDMPGVDSAFVEFLDEIGATYTIYYCEGPERCRLLEGMAWTVLTCASSVCKPLLWLKDSDSSLPLASELRGSLKHALNTIILFPEALPALGDKLGAIYDRALQKPLVGIGAQPRSSRLGRRTAGEGLLIALEYAQTHRGDFTSRALEVCGANNVEWASLFALVQEFIDDLDWGEFVLENARGQAACLVLEAIELLDAVRNVVKWDAIRNEVGDVFYNLMAFCLSVRIQGRHL
jgi:hypothetical protein